MTGGSPRALSRFGQAKPPRMVVTGGADVLPAAGSSAAGPEASAGEVEATDGIRPEAPPDKARPNKKQKRVADGKLQSPKKRKGEAKKASKVEEGKGRSKTRGRPSKKGKGKEDGVDKVVEVTPSIMDQPLTGALPVPSTQSQVKPITPQQVEDILLFTVNANTYLHKLQAERGASTCYMAGRGHVLQEYLPQIREETDATAEKLKASPIYPEVELDFNRSCALKQFRKDVDLLQLPFLEVMTGYNMLIEGILQGIFKLVNPLHSINVGLILGCYNSFLYLKDAFGRQRASVGGILSVPNKKGLDSIGHLTLVANLGAQKAFTKAFISTGISDDLRADFLSFCAGSPSMLRDLERSLMVSQAAVQAVLDGLTPETWYSKMSERMNILDRIQKELTMSILKAAKAYCEAELAAKPLGKARKKRKRSKADKEKMESGKEGEDSTTKADGGNKDKGGGKSQDDGTTQDSDGSRRGSEDDVVDDDFLAALSKLADDDLALPEDWTLKAFAVGPCGA